MSLKNSYKILKKENLIVEFFQGIITIDSFIQFKEQLIQDSNFSLDYNYFIYFKEVTFNIKPQEISKYIDFSNKKLPNKKTRKIAIVTHTPKQVVLTTLYKMQTKDTHKKVEIFSTCGKAFYWLDTQPLFDNEKSFIKELQAH